MKVETFQGPGTSSFGRFTHVQLVSLTLIKSKVAQNSFLQFTHPIQFDSRKIFLTFVKRPEGKSAGLVRLGKQFYLL